MGCSASYRNQNGGGSGLPRAWGGNTTRSTVRSLLARSLLAFAHLCLTTTAPLALPAIAPEPHVLLFRRAKNFDSHQAALQAQAYEAQVQYKAVGAAKNGRKK